MRLIHYPDVFDLQASVINDPEGNIRSAIARYPLGAIVNGIAIFQGKRDARTLPDGVDARYLLGIVKNVSANNEGLKIIAASPPHDVARDILAFPPPELPIVEAIASTPLFGAEGNLLQGPGLHGGDRLWLQPDAHLRALDVPEAPDATDVTVARAFLSDELLCDFPLVDDGDRAHAIAALLLPFARRLIDGPTPLHVVEAPSAGSGKGLFSNLVSLIATGRPCDGRTLPVGSRPESSTSRQTSAMRAALVPPFCQGKSSRSSSAGK